MSLLSGLAKARSPTQMSANISRVLTLDSTDGWFGTDTALGMSRDRAMKISTVNRCVEVLSTSMAVLPVFVIDESTHERVKEHRLNQVLGDRANEDMTQFDFRRLMLNNELLKGNAYAWINRDPRTGYPVELVALPPDHVTIYVEPSGMLWYIYTNPRTGEMTRLHQTDVLHYKAYSTDGIRGISVLKRAAQTMIAAESAAKYETSVYQNGGRPSGVLTAEADLGGKVTVRDSAGNEETITKRERIRREWDRIHRGPDNAFRLAVLDNGLKYQPISMSNADAQFVESKEVRVADLCRFFGVPLHLVYAGKQSYNSNEQNAIEFVKYTLLGYSTQWQQEDTYKMLLPSERRRSLRVKHELKVFLQGDTTAQAAWYRTMREIGAYNADEIRALDDRPAIPGGASYYASWNYGPLDRFVELSIARALGRLAAPEEL